MSDQNINPENVVSDSVEGTTEDKTVSYESYERAIKQRKADQAKAREIEQRLNELMAEKKAQEEAALADKQEWKTLFEKKQAELEQFQGQMSQMEESVKQTLKLTAFKEHIGDLAHPKYASLIDLSAIKMDEHGQVDKESLGEYGKAFKESHHHLLKASKVNSIVSSDAPKETPLNTSRPLTNKEKLELARQNFRNNYGK